MRNDLPAVVRKDADLCPPREALIDYARGGRNPRLAGHVSRCDRCAWIVSEAMEAETAPSDAEVIDIAIVRPGWFQRLLAFTRNIFGRP
jgi:hypothetical protein